MPLNSLGDFLAGVFGPLALFWLVLGFLQQGIELKQNTKALELQAEELRNSVTQQKELVAVTRAQFKAELEALKREQLKQREAAKPKFIFGEVGAIFGGQRGAVYSARVENVGNATTNVSFRANRNVQMSIVNKLSWTRYQNEQLKWTYEKGIPEEGVVLTITYVDALGFSGEQGFAFNPVDGGEHAMVEIVPIAG